MEGIIDEINDFIFEDSASMPIQDLYKFARGSRRIQFRADDSARGRSSLGAFPRSGLLNLARAILLH